MHLTFYPIDFHYQMKEGKVWVFLWGKQEDGQQVCVRVLHHPFFFAQMEDIAPWQEKLERLRIPLGTEEGKINGWEKTEKELLGEKKTFYKIFTNVPKAVPPLSKELESWGIPCLERDILFIHRFLRDKGIVPGTRTEAEGAFTEPQNRHIPVFMATLVLPAASPGSMPPCKVLALDLETYTPVKIMDPQRNPILMAAFSGRDEKGALFRKVITWKTFPHSLEYVEVVADEAALVQRCKEIIVQYQPDIVTGYNSDGFDFPYLQTRAEKYHIPLNLGRDGSDLEIRQESKIVGIPHLDLYQFIRRIFGRNLKTDTYSLDAVAFELLGHKKHPVNLDQLSSSWDHHPEALEEFCKYNMHDADLTLQLCQKLLPPMMEFAQLTGLPPFDVIRLSFSRLVEAYILKRAPIFQVIAPNRPQDEEMAQRQQERYEGGFVYEPTPGLYSNIVVFDFRSLYPSIITAHNVGPEGFHCACCADTPVPGFPDYWFCRREKKFLPAILEEVILLRAEVKKQLKKVSDKERSMLEARSYALKLLANSFYGYLGFSGARWYHFPSARATTAYARNYIQETLKKAEQEGFRVCYSDTDSCFLLLDGKTRQEAQAFMEQVNATLPGHMELELEGAYPRGIFVALKHAEKGAKKKYALLREDGKIKIVGFETVRRNWSTIAKEVQLQVLQEVLQERVPEAVQYVRRVVEDLKAGTVPPEKLVIRTKITRDMDKYASAGPHVIIARRMREQGYPVSLGMIVEYVIGKGSGLVRERARLLQEADGYDAEYYISHQLIPAVSSIFAVFGYTEDQVFSDSRQMGLGSFG